MIVKKQTAKVKKNLTKKLREFAWAKKGLEKLCGPR